MNFSERPEVLVQQREEKILKDENVQQLLTDSIRWSTGEWNVAFFSSSVEHRTGVKSP